MTEPAPRREKVLAAPLRAVSDDIAAIRAARPELFSDSGAGSPVRRSISRLR